MKKFIKGDIVELAMPFLGIPAGTIGVLVKRKDSMTVKELIAVKFPRQILEKYDLMEMSVPERYGYLLVGKDDIKKSSTGVLDSI